MSVTTHITEIIRQGIWASLTGGWYYEPSHSVFCNTLHLYLWLLLLILPLIVGLSMSATVSLPIMMAYMVFIMLLFTLLKIIVSYLHVVFDTTEPIITSKFPETTTETVENVSETSPGSGLFRRRTIPDMIELTEMPFVERPTSTLMSRIIEQEARGDRRRRNMQVDFRYNPSNTETVVETAEVSEIGASTEGTCTLVEDREMEPRNMCEQTIPEEDEESDMLVMKSSMKRKFSEPLLPIEVESWKGDRRRSSDGGDSRVRRANSTFESRRNKDMQMLSERSLEQARYHTHKSYPYKMSSEEEFHSRKLVKKTDFVDSTNMGSNTETAIDEANDAEVSQSNEKPWKDSGSTKEFGPQYDDEPCCSKDTRPVPVIRPGTPLEPPPPKEMDSESSYDISSTSSSAWIPVRVSLNDTDRPSTSAGPLARIGEDSLAGSSDNSADIKGEITKFLEDLIDKHPETLDAIESVRMSRLGRNTQRVQQTAAFIRNHYSRRRGSAVSALSDLANRDGTHVANGHEDTTQGAVHSFQDDEGNWWTYAFDEQGFGVAQPLGSGPALMEMIQRERSSGPLVNKKGTMEILPELTFDMSSEDEGETHVPAQTRVVQTTRRERALSSSSNDSYTYIPSLPTSVMHASSRTGATRSSTRQPTVSFSDVASRIRSVISAQSEDRRRSTDLDQILELLDIGRNNSSDRESRVAPRHERIFRMEPRESLYESFFGDGAEMGMNAPEFQPFTAKKSYYYQMKMFPKTNKNFKVKIDRLAVAALFDRNRGAVSCIFDIVLATMVSFLAALVLSTGVFYDLSLFFFAFVVAGAHFSLLKSVQPDAASPIHGFNWLVAYSRPVYFCILCSILLGLHYAVDDGHHEKVVWNFNLYRLNEMSSENLLLGLKDFVALSILLLPIAFTFGWLPQVSTLAHHIMEQIDIHLFGGTASFGVLSAIVQLIKSSSVYVVLTLLCHVAYQTNSASTQNPAFSAFVACSVGASYWLSRFSSNTELTMTLFRLIWNSIRSVGSCASNSSCIRSSEREDDNNNEGQSRRYVDPLPECLRTTISLRARHDLLFGIFLTLIVFALHSTSVFTATSPYFLKVTILVTIVFGIINHYLYPELRTHTPWKLFAKPILRSVDYHKYESGEPATLLTCEFIHVWMKVIEKNVLYPLLVVSMLCDGAWSVPLAPFLVPLITIRLLRGAYCNPQLVYIPLTLSYIAVSYDWSTHLPSFYENWVPRSCVLIITFFLLVLIFPKWLEFYLKINFIMAYVAPWQISWGSAFHAFAQPFSVPHSAIIWAQTMVSSVVSAPLNPFLGSSFFLASYVRPIKFWERDYNTKRNDASNMRLASQFDRGPMIDDSNLNAVFYEHLTRSLQKCLAGDIMLGRWGTNVEPGDCFILASFYLNCLVHIIEVGNGFVTFQLRGLEFRGTYCHQREVEAISEDQTDSSGFCCCNPGSLPGFLSLNTAWSLRWLAWEVVSGKYTVDGYSITDNSAVNLLQVHELRRLLVSLFVRSIVYYTSFSPKLRSWMESDIVRNATDEIMNNVNYVDLDPMFGSINDEDFDPNDKGISKASFMRCSGRFVKNGLERRRAKFPDEEDVEQDRVMTLCYMLSLVGRRALGTAAHNRHSTAAESFLYGLHALFKGDFRIQCQRDEWVFADMDLLRCVIAPAVKMAMKLHQDHFAAMDDLEDPDAVFNLIDEHQANIFISHEQDPDWRKAILSNTPSLLALRHMYDDGQDDYKIIMLNRMHLNMRVIKLNRECVRAFWAGQQQELIFLRNRNPERGSIQNARQVLRNMINSSADQPVGYPIYVSPLTTSFVETHDQMKSVVGPVITLDGIGRCFFRIWQLLRFHMDPSTSSMHQGGCPPPTNIEMTSQQHQQQQHPPPPPSAGGSARDSEDRSSQSSSQQHPTEHSMVVMGTDGSAHVTLARRSQCDTPLPNKKVVPGSGSRSSFSNRRPPAASLAAVESDGEEDLLAMPQVDEDGFQLWVEIIDEDQIFRFLSEPLRNSGDPLVVWPSEELRQMANCKQWFCQPAVGMTGRVIFQWYPMHPRKRLRSHVLETIYLISVPIMANSVVAIAAKGCRIMSQKEAAIMAKCADLPLSICSGKIAFGPSERGTRVVLEQMIRRLRSTSDSVHPIQDDPVTDNVTDHVTSTTNATDDKVTAVD